MGEMRLIQKKKIPTAVFTSAKQPQVPNYHITVQNNHESKIPRDKQYTLQNLNKSQNN